MNEYLKKYPKQQQDVDALLFSLGEEKTTEICAQAIKEGKRLKVMNDPRNLDLVTYKFV